MRHQRQSNRSFQSIARAHFAAENMARAEAQAVVHALQRGIDQRAAGSCMDFDDFYNAAAWGSTTYEDAEEQGE